MQSIKPTVPFFTTLFPSLEEMTKEQLGFFYTWLNEMQQGNFLDIEGNLSYVFVYMYQVVTEKDYDEIIEQLLQIQNNYGEYSKINEYCNKWITDCYMAKRQFKKALHFSPKDFNIIKKAGKTLRIADVIDLYPPDYSNLTDFGRSKKEEINKEIVKIYIEIESQKSINLIDICTKIQKGFDYNLLLEARKMTYYEFDHNEFWSYIPDVVRIAEDRVRENLGLPKIGQGWLNETRLYYEIKKSFSAYKVTHHARLPFLGTQHLDIYIHELNIGLEYQGEQHSEPIYYFGGEDSLYRTKERDERKKMLCDQNGVHLIYVYPNYSYDNVLSEIRGICLEKGVVLNINTLEDKDRLEIQNKIDAQYFRNNANKPLSEHIDYKKNDVLNQWLNDHKRRLRHHHEKEIFNFIHQTLKKLDESTDPLDKHYYLEGLSYWYYRYKEYPGFIEKCIEYSLKDIEIFDVCMKRFESKNFDSLITEYRNIFGHNPISEIDKKRMLIHSFVNVIKRLTITYEKFGQFDLAIELCKKAIILGIYDDTTKAGFEKRIASLEKKRNKSGSSDSIQNPPAGLS